MLSQLYIYSTQQYDGCPIQNPATSSDVQCVGITDFGTNRQLKAKWKKKEKKSIWWIEQEMRQMIPV